jgi:hypothetical protein
MPLNPQKHKENPMQALFDAVDVTGISTNVSTLMIAFIGIGLLFLGYAYVRRTMSAGKRI